MITSEWGPNMEAQAFILHALHWIGSSIEALGVAIIISGVVVASVWSVRQIYQGEWSGAFRSYRANLGRGILLGLEFLIAADIIGMVAIIPTFERLGILGLIIVIRTFLSFSLQIEIEGRLPWRRHNAQRDDATNDGL